MADSWENKQRKLSKSRQHIHESFSQARSSCRKRSLPTGLLSTSINDVMNSRPRERNVALPIFIPSATWHDHHFVMTTGWLEIPPWLRKTGFTEPRVLTCFDPPAVPGCSAFFPSKGGTVWFWPAETCRRGLSPNSPGPESDIAHKNCNQKPRPITSEKNSVFQASRHPDVCQSAKRGMWHVSTLQATAWPSLQRSSVSFLPAETCVYDIPSHRGWTLHSPSTFLPQATALPSVRSGTVWKPPAETCVGYSFLQLWNGALSIPIPAGSHNVTIASEKHSVHLTCRNLDVGYVFLQRWDIGIANMPSPQYAEHFWKAVESLQMADPNANLPSSSSASPRDTKKSFSCFIQPKAIARPSFCRSTVWLCPPETIAQWR